MPSIIPGYEYDIFISYRHNDNRSGWVTEFVNALQEELAATIKEPVSVYFDTNPHDGLLETHHVDKSLEGKLKCLIFIPIISQTYCDPKSFAWQHEFCAFNKLAQEDEFGRDIKLSNGNVTSRILPIKIHNLDNEDKATIEIQIGGVLRAIEFIYKEAGVNRPLNSTDDKNDNQNKTDYRNQVNKVANAIKELINALNPAATSVAARIENKIVNPTKMTRKLGAIIAAIVFLIAVVAYFLYPKIVSEASPEETEISIAVLPFVNMSGEVEQEYFSDGISEELINALAKMPNIKVMGRTSSFAYKGKNENLQAIGKALGVTNLLEGSVRKSGNTLRITAQLIDAKNGFHLWTETYDRELEDVFKIQDEITQAIMKQLKVRLDANHQFIAKTSETNLGAYETYLKARQELALRGEHLYEARKLFERVIELDPNYSLAYSGLGITLTLIPAYFPVLSREFMEPAKDFAEKAILLNPNSAEGYTVMGCVLAFYEWNFKEGEKYFQRSYELSPNDTEVLNFLGDFYTFVHHPDAIEIEERALALDPLHSVKHADVARAYYTFHRWKEGLEFGKIFNRLEPVILTGFEDYILANVELGMLDEAERLVNAYPRFDEPIERAMLSYLRAWIALSRKDSKQALENIPTLELALKNGIISPAKLGSLFLRLNLPAKAAAMFEKAYQERDYYLLYDYRVSLPENMSDNPVIRKALDKPELNILFEMRRRNLNRK